MLIGGSGGGWVRRLQRCAQMLGGGFGFVVAPGVVFVGPEEVFEVVGGRAEVGEVQGGGCGPDVGDGEVMGGDGETAGLAEDFVAVKGGDVLGNAEVEHGVVEGAFLAFGFGEAPDVEHLLVPLGGVAPGAAGMGAAVGSGQGDDVGAFGLVHECFAFGN